MREESAIEETVWRLKQHEEMAG